MNVKLWVNGSGIERWVLFLFKYIYILVMIESGILLYRLKKII